MAGLGFHIVRTHADPIALHGFTQLPNFILCNPDISIGAKTTYSLFLSYAWHNSLSFPGLDTLAVDRCRHRRDHGRRHRNRSRWLERQEVFDTARACLRDGHRGRQTASSLTLRTEQSPTSGAPVSAKSP